MNAALSLAATHTENASDSIVIVVAGDLLLDRGVRPVVERRGVAWLFEGVSKEFSDADAVIVNLECPLTDVSTPLVKKFIFRADTRWAKGLRAAGVTHASMANNHSNDQGFQGLASTYKSLTEAGIVPVGTSKDNTPQLITSKSKGNTHKQTVAVFAAVLFPLENWSANSRASVRPKQVSVETLAKEISEYKNSHPNDVVVAVLHWGVEFQQSPSPKQRLQAQMLVSAGADVIVGHHPHVLQPKSQILGKPVFFSLGNFIFDQHAAIARRGALARIVIRPDTITSELREYDIIGCRPVIRK